MVPPQLLRPVTDEAILRAAVVVIKRRVKRPDSIAARAIVMFLTNAANQIEADEREVVHHE